MLTSQYLKTRLLYVPETGTFYHLPKSNPSHHEKIWNSRYAGLVAGRLTKYGHRTISIDDQKYSAHILAYLYMIGEFPSSYSNKDVHINGNRADNRWNNLQWIDKFQCRYCTRPLTGENWPIHNQKRTIRCCRDCENTRSRENRRKLLADPVNGPVARARTNKSAQLRRRAVRQASCTLTPDEEQRIAHKFLLASTLQRITGDHFEVDHIVPLHLGGLHHPDNLQVIPREINRSKGHRRIEIWYSDEYLWSAIGRPPPH